MSLSIPQNNKSAGHNRHNAPFYTPNPQISGAEQAQFALPYPQIVNPRGIASTICHSIPQNSKSAGHNRHNAPFYTPNPQISGAEQAQFALPYPQPQQNSKPAPPVKEARAFPSLLHIDFHLWERDRDIMLIKRILDALLQTPPSRPVVGIFYPDAQAHMDA